MPHVESINLTANLGAILKWAGLTLVVLIMWRIIGTWAQEFANRIMYRGLFSKGSLNRRKIDLVNGKDNNNKLWIDRMLEAQNDFTTAMVNLTKELEQLKDVVKDFKCNYKKGDQDE